MTKERDAEYKAQQAKYQFTEHNFRELAVAVELLAVAVKELRNEIASVKTQCKAARK